MRRRLDLALAAEKEWESSIIVILGARLVRRARPGFVGWVIVAIVRRLRHYRRPVRVVTTLIPGRLRGEADVSCRRSGPSFQNYLCQLRRCYPSRKAF